MSHSMRHGEARIFNTQIDLCGGRAGMSHKGLNGAKVAAMCQKMTSKSMPQGMRSGAFRKAKCAAKGLHQKLC